MTEETHSRTSRSSFEATPEFDDEQLRSTMRDFLKGGEGEQSSIWNIATIAGIAMFLGCMVYILQLIGLDIGSGFSGIFAAVTVFGAILIGFVGFGYFVGDRKQIRRTFRKQRRRKKDYFEEEFRDDPYDSEEDIDIEQELFGDSTSEESDGSRQHRFDTDDLRQPNKLYRSRTDKKLAGVYGGLAEYFGISATVIRVLFVITFFAGWGFPLLLYGALMVVLDKEPRGDE
jgi:phage shock protein C